VVWLTAAQFGQSITETQAVAADPPPVTIERTFVPAGLTKLWPGGREDDWVPIERGRLDTLLGIVNRHTSDAPTIPFDRAQYTARFDPAIVRLVKGTARLTGKSLQRSAINGLADMGPLNLAVSRVRWAGNPERPALLGTDRQAKQRLFVPEGATTLEFDWSLMGRQRLNGIEFLVRLPPAVVSTVALSVPSGWVVTSDTGVVSQELVGDRGLFTVEPGIRNDFRLRLLEPGREPGQSSAGHMACRLSSRYSFRTGHVSGVCEAGFSAIAPGTTELALDLSGELQIESVEQVSGGIVEWSVGPSASDPMQRLLIPLMEGSRGDRDFMIRFAADLPPTGVANIRAPRAEDAVLLDGRLTVAVDGPDRIQSYTPVGLRQTSVSLNDDRHQLSFQQFQQPATLDLRVSPFGGQRTQNVNAREFSLLDLTSVPPTLNAELELTPQYQGVFSVESYVPRGCEITTVEHVGNGNTERLNWSVLPASASHERLVITIPDGLPEEGMRFRIAGHYPDGELSSLVLPAILPVAVRSADIVVGVTKSDDRHLDVPDLSVLSAVTASTSFDRAAWSSLFQADVASEWDLWQASYRGQPVSLLRTRLAVSTAAADSNVDDPTKNRKSPVADDGGDAPEAIPFARPATETPASGAAGPPVVMITMVTRTNPGSTGRERHLISWRFLYASARETFNFEIPSDSHILSINWNDQPLEIGSDVDQSVAIPAAQPGDTLSVEFTLPSRQVVVVGPLRITIPRAEAIPVGFEWSVSTPKEFEVLSVDGGHFQHSQSGTGLQWLFGPLARRGSGRPFNPFAADDWQQFAGTSIASATGGADESATEMSDWRTITASAGAVPEELRVRVGHVVRLRALAWFTLAASLLIGVLLRAIELPYRNRIGLIVVITCGASGSLLPLPIAEIAGACVLGICIASFVPRRQIRREAISHSGMPSTVTLQRIPIGILLCLMVSSHPADAQSGGVETGSGQAGNGQIGDTFKLSKTVSVLIPYDGDGFRPDGISDTAFVRSRTLMALTATAEARAQRRPGPLINDAQWAGSVDDDGRVSLTLTMTVAAPPDTTSSLELPISASLLPAGRAARIDGTPAPILLTDGTKIRIDLPAPEPQIDSAPTKSVARFDGNWRQHVVQLDLQPPTSSVFEGHQLVLPDVPVAQNRVSLQFLTRPAVLASRGRSIEWALDAARTLNVPTGPESDLSIHWADRVLDDADGPHPGIEIRSAVELHTNWLQRRTLASYEIGESSVRSIAWRLPLGARITRQQIRTPQLAEVDIRESGTGVVVTVELEPPATSDFTLLMEWQQMLASNPQQSSLAWPVPVVPGRPEMAVPINRHLAGVTTGPGLEPGASLKAAAESSAADVDDYLELWPGPDRPRTPRLAIRVADDISFPPIAVPIDTKRQVRQRQAARISQKTIDWTIAAEIDTTQGRAFRHRFHVPPELEVEFVSVQEESVERLSHWDQQGNTLFLHLRDQTTGIQNIVIQGRQEFPPGQSFPVPEVRIIDGDMVESTLLVYRSPDVIPSVTNAEVIESATGDELSAAGLFFFRRYRLNDDDAAKAMMSVEPLDTPPSIWTVARLRETDGRMVIHATLRLEAMQLREAIISLADWPFDGVPEFAVADGDSGSTVGFDSEASVLRVSQSGSLPADLELTMSAWLEPRPDDEALVVAPPTVAGFGRNTALLSTSESHFRLDSGETPDAEALIEAQARGLLDPETADAYLVWKSGDRLRSTRETVPLEPPAPIVMHFIRPGLQDSGVAATQILMQAIDDTHVVIRWPAGARLVAIFRNGQRVESQSETPATAIAQTELTGDVPATKATRIAVPAEGSPSLIEVLWKPASPDHPLEVQRHTCQLPRVTPSFDDRTFVLAAPRAGISTADSKVADQTETTAQYSQAVLDWLQFLGQSTPLDAQAGARATLALWATGQSLNLSPGSELDSFLSAMPAAAPTSIMSPLTTDILTDGNARLLIAPPAPASLELWLITDWAKRLLTCAVLVLVALPVLALLFRLKSFDILARHPEAAWLLLGLVWWTCLAGSGAGFVAATLAALWMVIQWHRRVSPVQQQTVN